MPAPRKTDAPSTLIEQLNAYVGSKPVNDSMSLRRYHTTVDLMLKQVRHPCSVGFCWVGSDLRMAMSPDDSSNTHSYCALVQANTYRASRNETQLYVILMRLSR